jgi:von Willebrand factor type A domain
MSSRKSIELGRHAALVGALIVGVGACSSSLENDGSGAGRNASGNSFIDDGLTDASGSGAGFDSRGACVGQIAGAEVAPTVLQLIVDTSGSMNEDAPGPVRGSKWEATRSALLASVDQMPATTTIGVVFYPDTANGNNDDNQNACFDRQTDVPLQILANPGSPQRRQIRSAFQNQNPNGGTPTHDAYAYAVQDLEAAKLTGARFAVLITDGIPTFSLGCDNSGRGQNNAVDSAPLVVEAAKSLSAGVRTFVIGSPGSEGARENLSRMAEAGGTATPGCSHTGPTYCHFDMTETQDFAAALAKALGQISGLALSCSYAIPAPPQGSQLDPAKVNVLFSPSGAEEEVILRSPGNTCSEGWQYSQDGSQVILCGGACERVRQAEQGSLNLEFGCATTIR